MCSECTLIIADDGMTTFVDDNGHYHCRTGPAVIHRSGYVGYYLHNELHRVGAPARIWSNGYVEYWENGNFVKCDYGKMRQRRV